MTRRVFLIIIVIFLLLLLLGCEPPLGEGFVYDKVFSPAHTESSVSITLDGDGNMTTTPTTDYYPDRWWIKYKKLVNDSTNEYKYAERLVDQNTYEAFKVGDWISFER